MKILRHLTAALVIAGVTACATAAEANYIFYFIGDGMGPGAVMAADDYLRHTTQRPDTSLVMTTLPVASLCTTYSHSSPVTDSAAAGTALATGVKTTNGMLGMAPDTTSVTSIAAMLQMKGYGIGIITNVAADDATPGAFYAHVPERGMYTEIGRQAARSGFDFIGGAGLRGFSDKQGHPTGMASDFSRYNYRIVRGLDELPANSDARKIVLLGTDTIHLYRLGYSIEADPHAMDLTDMTRACIDHLERNNPDQFFMMVEGGAIDHGGHANDAATIVNDVLTFDRSLRLAYDFYLSHPDETLIIVTADHETGGMAMGNTPMGYMTATQLLAHQRVSKDTFSDRCKAMIAAGEIPSWEEMQRTIARDFGLGSLIPLTDEQTARLRRSYENTFLNHNAAEQHALYNNYCGFAVETLRVLDEHTGMGWTSINHTGNPVPVFAVGVGAEKFNTMMDNTQIPATIMEIVETFRNPPVLMR